MTKRTCLLLLSLTFIALSGCARSTRADEEASRRAALVPPSKAIQEAAELYKQREDPDKVRKALEVLDQARDPDHRNFEVEKTFAMYSYFLGSRDSVGDDEAETVLKKGLAAAKIVRRMEPKKPDGYFWSAAILGAQSKRAPVTVGIPSIKKIRDGMNKVLEIDPDYQAASAYLGLGQLELSSRGLAGGSVDKAIDYLEEGLRTDRKNAYIYFYLAEAYFAAGRDDDAKKVISDLENMTPEPDHVPEYHEALAKAEKLMENKS